MCDIIKQNQLKDIQKESYLKLIDSIDYYFKTFNISKNDFFDLLGVIEDIYYNFYEKNKKILYN